MSASKPEPARPRAWGIALAVQAVLVVAAPAVARADGTTAANADPDHPPARLAWAVWVGGGAGVVAPAIATAKKKPAVFGILGAELTVGVTEYAGFPAVFDDGEPPLHRARGHLRLGLWAATAVRTGGPVVEGGLTAHLGTVNDTFWHAARYGMFDLRFGAGYAAFSDSSTSTSASMIGWSPALSTTLAWGFRDSTDRWDRGCHAPPRRCTVEEATLVRLVTATFRAATGFPAWEALFGLELSPTFLLFPAFHGGRGSIVPG